MRPSATRRSTSRAITRPSGPVACAWLRSAWVRSARWRARGDILSSVAGTAAATGCASVAGAGAASASAAGWGSAADPPRGSNSAQLSPDAPITHTLVRQGTSSPSSKNRASTSPSSLLSSSKAALSVS